MNKTNMPAVRAELVFVWDLGFTYEQATELPALAAMSREEFNAEMAALDAASLAALEADARANP